MVKYFSMFTGVGGFENGIQQAYDRFIQQKDTTAQSGTDGAAPQHNTGFGSPEPVGFCEWDKYSSQVLRYHWPNVTNYGDATALDPATLPDFDVLVGGFPCQAFSIAGHRRGFEDARGTLFFDIARVLQAKKPAYFVLENVKGLLSHEEGKTFSVIIETLEELGYDIEWILHNSRFHGVPQNRERIFIIGSIRGKRRPEILPFRCSNCEDNEESGQSDVARPITTAHAHSTAKYMSYVKTTQDAGQSYRLTDTSGASPTITTPSGGHHLPKIMDVSYALDASYYKGTSEKDFLEKHRRTLV